MKAVSGGNVYSIMAVNEKMASGESSRWKGVAGNHRINIMAENGGQSMYDHQRKPYCGVAARKTASRIGLANNDG